MRACSALLAAALLAAFCTQARAAERAPDAMETFDETILRSFIILQCHASQDRADQEVMARVPSVRKAALDQLWAQFDRASPGRHEENGKNARETLDIRTQAHKRFIESQSVEYGCDWLDGKVFPPGR